MILSELKNLRRLGIMLMGDSDGLLKEILHNIVNKIKEKG